MFSRAGLLLSWKEIRPYFIFSIILFFAGVVIGGSPNAPQQYLEQQIKGLESIMNDINQSNNPELTAFVRITLNNVFAAVMIMAFGIVAGIMPVISLVSNGMVIGYVLGEAAEQGHNLWASVIKGILPHGIFELSAVFLAAAFGMRFGMTLIKGVFGSAFGKSQAWQPFVRTAIGAVPAVILVLVLLLVAGVVESTVTFWLMS
ncbi:stage II sporulation protein M [Cohnella cholangitidis]|uniref:Stage II sporulation protein M n=1 Tax=Cohnella cholangitidis TaxID=2598458 RepID=A0A7G5BX54_9BACL|nr:stage II sporulation protein M [Cohnella cholangitidis]QMV41538.1 stage II sporulation protein M [Cohnella cholangitidis]